MYHWQRMGDEPQLAVRPPRDWVCEPDAAILRAGLVQDVAALYGGTLLDPTIAYFCTDAVPDSAGVRAWRVLEWLPFHVKRLRAVLRERDIGRVTVKKRGFPMSPEELTAALRLKGEGACTLVCTRHGGGPVVLVCDEMPVRNRLDV